MGLKDYQKKRNFEKTPEPGAKIQKSMGRLNFCIQKHDARNLHYDFRLEYRGILLSWAVPKGPSLNPQDKRLAVKVEDHPLDYQYFEGTIPVGNYGAGTVEIWDHGFYTTPGTSSKEEMEKYIGHGLKKGHFAIILIGDKLQGEFVFQKLKRDPDDHNWLLIKKEDNYASFQQKTEVNASVKKKTNSRKHRKMTDFMPPMLATLIDQPFDDDEWLFEIKWDGYRALAFIDEGKVELKSRTNHLWNEKFPSIIHDLKKIKEGQVILDGELVVCDPEGKSHFHLMQKYQRDQQGALIYYVFDLLYKNGEDLRDYPLLERKELLEKFLKEQAFQAIRLSRHVIKEGRGLFKEAKKAGLEGIIGKKLSSSYQPKRSRDWLKMKAIMRQEVVICGFTAPRGSRKKMGALVVGVYDEDELKYTGHVGGGFNESLLHEVYEKLEGLVQSKCPFKIVPKVNAPVTWVKPKLICEVSFAEWTQDNNMRQPIFQGLRDDKDPKTIKRESPETKTEKESSEQRLKKPDELSLTHLDKIYWPEEGYTKGDLLKYYEAMAPYILPYLKDRPIVLHRFPEGIEGKHFYQKDIGVSHPEWIKTYSVQHEGKVDLYLNICDVRSLLYAVNLGSIDLHPFISRYQKLDNPDYCIIDLDPHGVEFENVIEVALMIHKILEEIQISHFCKTSGGKGLHILIPFNAKYDYEQSRQFAEIICHCIHQKFPKTTSVERNPQKRENKIYLDFLQNRKGQTIVSPYSVRPRPHALVSTPLSWEEVNKTLNPQHFTIKTIQKRLKKIGDIFPDVMGVGINLKKSLKDLSTFL